MSSSQRELCAAGMQCSWPEQKLERITNALLSNLSSAQKRLSSSWKHRHEAGPPLGTRWICALRSYFHFGFATTVSLGLPSCQARHRHHCCFRLSQARVHSRHGRMSTAKLQRAGKRWLCPGFGRAGRRAFAESSDVYCTPRCRAKRIAAQDAQQRCGLRSLQQLKLLVS